MEDIQAEIDRDGINDVVFAKEADAKTRYLKALENYEKLWAEKSRSRWREQGDRCSKLFHISVKMRRLKNSIKALKKDDGALISDKVQIEEYVSEYFELFHKEGALSLDKFRPLCMGNFLCKIISKILASARISVLLNGGPVRYFVIERGLRQGDPISPMLFIIAEEVLCRGLSELVASKSIKALPGPRGAITPTHILFANDVFIFSNASIRKQSIIEEFGIPICNFPTCYLGVEIFKGRIKKESLLPIMDRVKGRLAGWKGKIMSMAGRLELVRSVILGMMNHSSVVRWWPSTLIAIMEMWMKNFIWTGEVDSAKNITVRWDVCCRPKDEGGLGLRRLRDINKAMLCNMVWRVRHEKSTACNFLRARFLRSDGSFKSSYKSSSIWPGFRKMWDFMSSKEAWLIGNGENIKFWTDNWLGNKSILGMFDLEDGPGSPFKGKVSDFIENHHWKLPNVRSPLLQSIFEKIRDTKIPSYACEDMCLWSLSSDGSSSSNSAWNDIRSTNPKVPWATLI
ncbi:uncharacterized protein LOC122062568 [Macadamia integrifolia]|uniref:uncharacterized protein LOC122062568 n=1 Tax=Macadamia integrifolia TaxID=60698 RepID=UPI001C4F02CE|nr:uncharacterized protein LOC122062568 [Macadamia integrifolia]